jgi:hypothetical protein
MGTCDGIGRSNSEAISISINARSGLFYSETSRGEAGNLITNLLLLPRLRCARRPGCRVSSANDLLLAGPILRRGAFFACVVTESPVQRRHRLICIFDIARAQIIGVPANSPPAHIE